MSHGERFEYCSNAKNPYNLLYNLYIPWRSRRGTIFPNEAHPDVVVARNNFLQFLKDEVNFPEHEAEHDEDADMSKGKDEFGKTRKDNCEFGLVGAGHCDP